MSPGAVKPDEFRRTRLLRILLVTWVGYAAYSMGRRPVSVARSVISNDTGISPAATGAVDTAFLVMYTMGQLAYGPIQATTGWSARALLSAGLAGSACTLFLFASSSSLTTMCLAWGLNGLLQAVGWASCMIVVSPWLGTAERGMIMGLWGTTMAVGGVAGNTITPFAIGHTGSWRSGTMVVGALMFGAAALQWLVLGRHPNAHGFVSPAQAARGIESISDMNEPFAGSTSRTVEGEITTAKEAEKPIAGDPVEKGVTTRHLLFGVPGVLGICSAYFCAKLVRYVLMFWLPFYFTDALHHSTSTAGMLASALDIGGVIGTIGSGYLSDKFHNGERRTGFTALISVAMVVFLGGFSLGSGFATNAAYAIAVGFACGACAYGIDSIMTGSLIQDFAERQGLSAHLGAISGLVGGLGTLGSVLQGPFTVVFSGQSWEVLFGLLQVLTIASIAFLYRPLRMELSQSKQSPATPGGASHV